MKKRKQLHKSKLTHPFDDMGIGIGYLFNDELSINSEIRGWYPSMRLHNVIRLSIAKGLWI